MKPPRSILVVITRRIGDVLLTTPLIRSLRLAYPQARIDVLVFAGTQSVIESNPDIHQIITVPHRPAFKALLSLIRQLWRQYDLALSVPPGDRPTLYTCIAGRWRVGLVVEEDNQKWKKWLLSQWVPFDNLATHTVRMNLKLAEAVGVKPCHEVVVSWQQNDEAQVREALDFDPAAQQFVVLHVYPMFAYKMWRQDAWAELARWLSQQGLRIVLSGGKDAAELEYIQNLLQHFPPDTINAAGKLSLGGVAYLLSRAHGYVGPDTAVTHMAAALGIPTVALFGPSNPVKWGPWPKGFNQDSNPFSMQGTQRVNNVVLLQGPGDCVPCMEEGCERNTASLSACLQNLPATTAIHALQALWQPSAGQMPGI